MQAAVELDEPVDLPQQPSEVGRKADEYVGVVERRAGEGHMFQFHRGLPLFTPNDKLTRW
jgi:hypothetical protein